MRSEIGFWAWLPKAYRDGDSGEEPRFTKYNMEVAYLAGATAADERVAELKTECERQRERANEAQSRVDVLQATVDQKYRIHAELETALGVIHLEADEQMAAALTRVKALEAVAKAARTLFNADGMAPPMRRMVIIQDALAALDAKGGSNV